MELEKELRACALFPVQEEPEDVSDKKIIKRQKAALLRAFIWNYLWSCYDWKNMKEHPAGRAMARNLLWGYYRNGELQTAFALKEDGSVVDGKGESRWNGFHAGLEYLNKHLILSIFTGDEKKWPEQHSPHG